MDRVAKETFVTELRDRLNKAPVVYLTDFTGLSVKEMTGLRRSLKESGAEYLVVKNRLAKLAFAETELPDITENLEGPTGMVFGYDGPVAPAKALSEFAKLHDKKPAFKLGIMDAEILDTTQIDRIAKIPSHEVLLAQLAGVLEAPLVELASVLGAKLQEMAGLLGALQARGPEEPVEEEAAEEPEPAEEEAAEEPVEEEAAEEPVEEEAAEEPVEEEAAEEPVEEEAAEEPAEEEAAEEPAEEEDE